MLLQKTLGIVRTQHVARTKFRAQSSFMDGVKKFFDDIAFENWAPRSSRTWRLSLPPKTTQEPNRHGTDADQGKRIYVLSSENVN